MATGLSTFWSGLKPETQAALIEGGFGAIGGIGKSKAEEARTKFQTGAGLLSNANANTLDVRKGALDLRSSDFGKRMDQTQQDFQNKSGEIDAADRLVLGAMGRSPLDFANQRGAQAARAEIFSKPMVPGYLSGQVPGFMASGLSPQTIQMMTPTADKEKAYWDAVAMGSKGRFGGANLGASYGDEGSAVDQAIAGTTGKSGDFFKDLWGDYETGRDTDWNRYEGTRDQGISEIVTLADGQKIEAAKLMDIVEEKAKKEGGGGFWSKVGGIMKVVGPIAAMAIPGIGIPLGIALSAGTSTAGTKLQGGSWGQALAAGGISAGTGALLGGLGSKVTSAFNPGQVSANQAGVNAAKASATKGLGGKLPWSGWDYNIGAGG